MMKNESNRKRALALILCFLVITASALGQRRECPLAGYDGNWAFGTTTTFHVGDPFDGIGQVEVRRPGKTPQIHEKNRKWMLDGVRIKPGEVLTKAGKFIMTIESNGYKTAYNVEILPAVGGKKPVAKVISYPIQTEYKVGDRFYVDGIKVECHDANGRKVNVEPKDITFFTSISNTLVGAGSQCGGGYKFATGGKKTIEVRYKYATIGKFTINVAEGKSSSAKSSKPKSTSASSTPKQIKTATITNGWYNLRAMNNYFNFNTSGFGELRKKSSNAKFYVEKKGSKEVTIKLENGRYLGIDKTIKNGTRVKAVSSPYLWSIYSENNKDIFSLRPTTNVNMVMNASGQKNSDGTQIILWMDTDFNAPNHAEFRFIPVR